MSVIIRNIAIVLEDQIQILNIQLNLTLDMRLLLLCNYYTYINNLWMQNNKN